MKSSRNGIPLPYNRGFTLIELLVVIAIIGTLASIVMASVNSARAKARDAQRVSDIKQMNTAIELYISDNGQAPMYDDCPNDSCYGNERNDSDWEDLANKLKPYISKLPKDPCGTRCDDDPGYIFFSYQYRSPGQDARPTDSYAVWASHLEKNNEAFGFTTQDRSRPGFSSY